MKSEPRKVFSNWISNLVADICESGFITFIAFVDVHSEVPERAKLPDGFKIFQASDTKRSCNAAKDRSVEFAAGAYIG